MIDLTKKSTKWNNKREQILRLAKERQKNLAMHRTLGVTVLLPKFQPRKWKA